MRTVYMDSFTMTAIKDEQLNMDFDPGFTPRMLQVVVGARSNAEDTITRQSYGQAIDGHLQYTTATFNNSTRNIGRITQNRIAVVIEIHNGNPNRVIDWEFIGWNQYGPNIRVHKFDTRFQGYFTVWGD